MSLKPWMKFFPADWQADHLLRSCSLAARGLWVELLSIMWKADPVGHLLVNGRPPSPALLARLCGASEDEVGRLSEELQAAGVFDLIDGVPVSRRMVRDADRAARDKANGSLGGNPQVKVGVNPPVNPPVKPRVKGGLKAHMPEARVQNPEESHGASAPSERAPPDRFEEFWRAYPKRHGENPKKPARATFDRLVKAGADPGQIIAGAQRLAKASPEATRFVPQAKTWLNEERYREGESSPVALVDDGQWRKRLSYARQHSEWSLLQWGPMPGTAGCLVPPHLLSAGDGSSWREASAGA